MRLRVKFGFIDTKDISWWNKIDDFPKIIKFLGRNYEWVYYDKDLSGTVDMVLHFSELPSYDPNYNVDCKTWNELFPEVLTYGCECGASHTSFPTFHMFFCRLWRKW